MKRQELLDALELVRPGLAKEEVIEQTTFFAFAGGNVLTYNDEISISHPVKGLVELEGAVKAEELYQLLGKLDKEDLELGEGEGELLVKAGKTRAGIALQKEIKLPLEEIGGKGKWKKLPEEFLDAIKFTMFSCSKDTSRPVLTCINVREDGIIESTDNFRLTRYQLGGKIPVKSFLLISSSAKDLIKYDINQIAEGDSWIHFKSGKGTVFSCRTFLDDYPSLDELLKVKGAKLEIPKGVDDSLKRAAIFSKRENELEEEALISFEKGKLKVRGQGPTGWLEEELDIKYKGKKVTISVNPHFLQAILPKVTECVLAEGSMKFEGEDWVHLVALFT